MAGSPETGARTSPWVARNGFANARAGFLVKAEGERYWRFSAQVFGHGGEAEGSEPREPERPPV